jgi:hypothetical protein
LRFIVSSFNEACSSALLLAEGTVVINVFTLAFVNLRLFGFPAFLAFLLNRLNCNDNHCDYIDSNIGYYYCNERPANLIPLVLAFNRHKRQKWNTNEVERDFIEDFHGVEEFGTEWEV